MTTDIRNLTDPTPSPPIYPPHAIGAFLPVSQRDVELFNDMLDEELDSSFSSSACCCDFCYDEFASLWPGVIKHSSRFQSCSIPLDLYLENSRIREVYSEPEFSTLRNLVTCRRCGTTTPYNLWIYEHEFNSPEAVELNIREIEMIADRTPFLLLTNEFAQHARNQIRIIASTAEEESISLNVFRARTSESIVFAGQDPDDVDTFGPPPASRVAEGRFNHAGHPMLYLGDTEKTVLNELGGEDGEVVVAQLELAQQIMKVLDFIQPAHRPHTDETLVALADSALLSAPTLEAGWRKPQYTFSRFIADCARESGFGAIRYGSTKHCGGVNLVLLDPPKTLRGFARLVSIKVHQAPKSGAATDVS